MSLSFYRQQQKQNIVNMAKILYEAGMSLRDVAKNKDVNKSHEWVRIELKKLGVETGTKKEGGEDK